jgi:hydrogenase maturation factor
MGDIPTTNLVVIISAIGVVAVNIINAYYSAQRGKRIVAKADLAMHSAERAMKHGHVAAVELRQVLTARADGLDVKLDEIHEATNGGVQALRDEVRRLTEKLMVADSRVIAVDDLLRTAVADLKAERAK